jgi:hypothetical protein
MDSSLDSVAPSAGDSRNRTADGFSHGHGVLTIVYRCPLSWRFAKPRQANAPFRLALRIPSQAREAGSGAVDERGLPRVRRGTYGDEPFRKFIQIDREEQPPLLLVVNTGAEFGNRKANENRA